MIIEMIGNGTPSGERARAIYGLHLALGTRQGKAHILSDLRAWVEQAGLIAGEVIALDTPRGMGALVARAPLQEASTKERREEE